MKTEIRKKLLARRKNLSSATIRTKSRAIARSLFALPDFQNADTIMFYVSQGSEVYTHQMIRNAINIGKRIVVPVTSTESPALSSIMIRDFKRDLSPGASGVLEPVLVEERQVPPRDIDLVILPGIAFDLQGNRLGRGLACYDSFLKTVRPVIPRIALAFEQQIIHNIPAAAHDVPVTRLITEKRVITCRVDNESKNRYQPLSENKETTITTSAKS